MYSDIYKIRLPREVLADVEETTLPKQAKAPRRKGRQRDLKPFTGKEPPPIIKEILAAVESPVN
tara:strand:- start:89 stop:280 length:192 start_codon:yes stop_codon:yes gene_type:complete